MLLLLTLRSLASQACACLQPHRKRPRRASDDSSHPLDNDSADEELAILIDDAGSSSNSEVDELRGARAFTKRGSKSAALNAQEEDGGSYEEAATGSRLLGVTSGDDVLHSYQQVTGVVDEGEKELECVMCLDTFSAVNPKVRTLCNCGMNRTNFHMSCLLEWKNRDAKCPVCREYLYYED